MPAQQRRSPARRLLSFVLPWVGVVALTLVAGELVARFAFGVRPLTLESLVWRYDPRRGWAHTPNSSDTFIKVGFEQEVRINSRGLREREIPYEKPPGEIRILVIGDSSVVSFEVPPEAVFTRVAEDALRERGYPVTIINGGVRGYGTDQALLFLEDEGIRYQPDLVIYKWTDNDRDDNATIHRPFRKFGKPWFDLENGALVLRGVPVPDRPYRANLRVGGDGEVVELPVPVRSQLTLWLRDNVVCRSAFATALLRIAIAAPALRGSVTRMGTYDNTGDVKKKLDRGRRLYRVTLTMIDRMRRVSEAAGARFAMIDVAANWPSALREDLGLPDLGTDARYRASIPQGADLFVPYDPHLNEFGHRLYGTALAESLVASGLLEQRS